MSPAYRIMAAAAALLASPPAQAAFAIHDARIIADRLLITGTVDANATVTVVGRSYATKASAKGAFTLDVAWKPPSCLVDLKTGSTVRRLVVADCAPVGAKGPSGSTGPRGAAGAIGPQGAAGPKGATGPSGDRGATGPQGARGAVGDKGQDGGDDLLFPLVTQRTRVCDAPADYERASNGVYWCEAACLPGERGLFGRVYEDRNDAEDSAQGMLINLYEYGETWTARSPTYDAFVDTTEIRVSIYCR